jgi:hypothetical protein
MLWCLVDHCAQTCVVCMQPQKVLHGVLLLVAAITSQYVFNVTYIYVTM